MKPDTTKLVSAAADAGKMTKDLFSKAKKAVVKTVDQNEDGSLGLDDVSIIIERTKATAKENIEKRAEKRDKAQRELDLKTLRPIFPEDLDSADFRMTKLIRVTEIDKKRAESEACQNAIGYYNPEQSELEVVNIYRDKVDDFGVNFFPDKDSEIYYVDPCDRDRYIALDEYFNQLRVERINELQRIAQALGAKHFKVTYKEQTRASSSSRLHGKANGQAMPKQRIDVEFGHDSKSDSFSKIEIAAEMECVGHEPVQPTLRYFQKDPSIQTLVTLRMDKNPMKHQKYMLCFSNSSGIRVKDAAKVDAALSAMKCRTQISVENEAKSETAKYFEYEIEF